MTLALLYGHKYPHSEVRSEFGSIVFDTVTVEEHKYASRVTNFPVEFGPIVSDHIVKEPDRVNITGIVSDTPINIFAPFNRSVDVFNKLVDIQARRVVVELVTGIKVYSNMAITLLDVPRNIKTGQTLTFNIEFQKIVFVDTIQLELNQGNIFEGVRNNTPRAIVRDNTNIPLIQNDPPYSLKDQAESLVNVGVQSLAEVPTAMLPQVLLTASYLRIA